jgi:hypothetical protein
MVIEYESMIFHPKFPFKEGFFCEYIDEIVHSRVKETPGYSSLKNILSHINIGYFKPFKSLSDNRKIVREEVKSSLEGLMNYYLASVKLSFDNGHDSLVFKGEDDSSIVKNYEGFCEGFKKISGFNFQSLPPPSILNEQVYSRIK